MSSRIPDEGKLYFLDACCLINLFATERFEEILDALPHRFAVARYVAEEEVLGIRPNLGVVPSPPPKERIPLNPRITELARGDHLELLDVSTAEEEVELVRFAARLDDGEAHTLALAITRNAGIVTDDRKALRVFEEVAREQGQKPDILRTSGLLFAWVHAKSIAEAELVEIIGAIARRASFFPPKTDPHFERWVKLLQKAG